MKGLRNIPRILKINAVEGTTISLLFNNGESRTVDFVHLLQQVLQKKPGQLGYQLLEDAALFANVALMTLRKIVEAGLGKRLTVEIV